MINKPVLSGEDRVIIAAMICITLLILCALAAISFAPSAAGNVASVLAGAVVAIGSLAARHPPVVAPAPLVALDEPTSPIVKG